MLSKKIGMLFTFLDSALLPQLLNGLYGEGGDRMSVIVKNMKMPKNCSNCPLNYDQMSCSVTGTGWWSDTMVLMEFDSCKERLHDCPLIELPPHGRLIDADKLNIHDVSPVDGFCVMGVTEEDIELAETAIEAEGSEE